MTVSADGKFVCTDVGVGIRQPGWHGVGDDDVQVRNVEFYIDGERVATDGNFPFDTVF